MNRLLIFVVILIVSACDNVTPTSVAQLGSARGGQVTNLKSTSFWVINQKVTPATNLAEVEAADQKLINVLFSNVIYNWAAASNFEMKHPGDNADFTGKCNANMDNKILTCAAESSHTYQGVFYTRKVKWSFDATTGVVAITSEYIGWDGKKAFLIITTFTQPFSMN